MRWIVTKANFKHNEDLRPEIQQQTFTMRKKLSYHKNIYRKRKLNSDKGKIKVQNQHKTKFSVAFSGTEQCYQDRRDMEKIGSNDPLVDPTGNAQGSTHWQSSWIKAKPRKQSSKRSTSEIRECVSGKINFLTESNFPEKTTRESGRERKVLGVMTVGIYKKRILV